jgi:hypothetical protein
MELIYTRACAWCGAEFTPKRRSNRSISPTQTCSRSCATKLAKNSSWTPAEIELLAGLAGEVPTRELRRRYNNVASRMGFPARSDSAIKSKASRLGYSTTASGKYVAAGELARSLGVPLDTVRHWIRAGFIASRQYRKGSGHHYVKRKAVVELARQRPQLFGGLDRTALMCVLEDEQLVELIASSYDRRPSARRAVRCVETGQQFDSTRDAARAMWVRRQAITFAIRTGGTCAGWHWAWA